MNKAMVIGAAVLAFILGSATANAGYTFLEGVVIIGNDHAEGTVYQTRVSYADNTQSLYCTSMAWQTGSLAGSAYCYARDSSGNSRIAMRSRTRKPM